MDQKTESSGLELRMYITFKAHLQGPLSNFQGHKYHHIALHPNFPVPSSQSFPFSPGSLKTSLPSEDQVLKQMSQWVGGWHIQTALADDQWEGSTGKMLTGVQGDAIEGGSAHTRALSARLSTAL